MAIAEAGAVNGEKPRAHADISPSAGSVQAFDDALGRSVGSAPTTQAERRTQFIQDLGEVSGGEHREALAKMSEDLVKSGAKTVDFARVEVQAKAPADPDLTFVEAAHEGRSSHLPSFAEFNKDLAAQTAYNGLNPPSPFEHAKWRDDAVAATEAWDKDVFGVFGQHDKLLKNEAAGPRHVGEVASMAWNSIFDGIGLPTALGPAGALLATGGEALSLRTVLESSTGISTSTWLGRFAEFGPGVSFGTNLINWGNEGIGAGSNRAWVVGAAATDPFGGKIVETMANRSNLTGEDLNLSTREGVTGDTFDLVEGRMNITGARAFAKAPDDVEETPLPLPTSAELTGNDTPTSTPTQLSTGSTGTDDIAANAGTGEGARPSDATSSSTADIASDRPDRGDPTKPRNAAGADAAEVQSSSSSATEAGSDGPVPARSVDRIVDAHLQERSPDEFGNSVGEDDIARVNERSPGGRRKDEEALEIAEGHADERYGGMPLDDLYRPYSQPAIGKSQPTITAAQLRDQLKQHEGTTEWPEVWDIRMNKPFPITPAEHSSLNPDQAHLVVDAASGGAGGDQDGSHEERREQRRYRRPGERRSQPDA